MFDPAPFFTASGLSALVTLTLMEIILGIDNVVFLALTVARLPREKQGVGRKVGMTLALLCRLGLLFSIKWVMGLNKPWFSLLGKEISGHDLILIAGGLFLIAKASLEIYAKLEGEEHGDGASGGGTARLGATIVQIILLDLVFSLDSVITAVGMAQDYSVMVVAMFIAVVIMTAASGRIGDFVIKHPSIKILALSFLNLIGVMLFAEGLGQHVAKGTIYTAMAFSLGVELLNMRYRKKHRPVELRDRTRVLHVKPGAA